MTLSPHLQERLRKFRRSRRAWWSLILLLAFFVVSLPVELLCNDRPYVIKFGGRWYWPMLKDYLRRDFGLGSDLPVADYRGFLAELRAPPAVVPAATGKAKQHELFGDDNESLDLAPPKAGPAAGSPERSGADHEQLDRKDLARRPDAGEDVARRAVPPAPAPTAAPPAAAVALWTLWPPIRYAAATENHHHTTERGHLISPFSYVSEVSSKRAPGAWQDGHYLGTDEQGRDVLARLIYGFRVSLIFGLGLALTGTLIGCLLGGLQGYFGGWTDLLGQRTTEIWGSMPQLFLLIILSSFLSSQRQLTAAQHFLLLFGILNLTAWMGLADYMRAQFLRARNLDYVKAAKALGQTDFKIMLRHILPNSLVPVVTFMPFAVTGGITALVSLDFLGFGVKYPAPSLGNLLAQGQATMKWWIIFPTFVIFAITLILLTFVGEGVRNAFDPRHKG